MAAGYVQAEDRALLIGVGDYQIGSASLPGIEHDLRLMREVATKFGYGSQQIKVLKNERATLAAVERALKQWLVEGVNPDDRVLIYFSGHGSRTWDESGDETHDGADEVLMLYDSRVTKRDEREHLEGVLLDDRFNQLLKKIPSRNILVLVDACHSGTSTKFFDWQAGLDGIIKAAKYFSYPGMPGAGERNAPALDDDRNANYVAIGASEDDEKALPSKEGSYFTRGIHHTVMAAADRPLTPRQLLTGATGYIKEHVQRGGWFHPHLSGNGRQADRAIY